MLAAVAVAGGSGSPTPATYALTLGSQADADTLTGVQFPAPTATKNGAPIAITGYAWTVTGPVTLDNAAIAQPTPTHTGPGTAARQLRATLADGAVVDSVIDGWTVGTEDSLIRTHQALWKSAALAGAYMGTTTVIDGISITFGYAGGTGGSTLTATENVGLVSTVAGGATNTSLDWAGLDVGALTANNDDTIIWYYAVGASVDGAGDQVALSYLDSGGTNREVALLIYSSGVKIRAQHRRSGSTTEFEKTPAAHPRVIALAKHGPHEAEVRYSTTEFDGTNWPRFEDMTPVLTTRTSNKYTVVDNSLAADTADVPSPTSSIGRLAPSLGPHTIEAQAIFWRKGVTQS